MENSSHKPTGNGSKNAGIWTGVQPQMAFIFGIIAGVALSVIAVWAYPLLTSKKTAVVPTNTAQNTNTGPVYTDVAAVTDQDYIRGETDAKLTLVEYSDLECPYCQSFHATMQRVMEEYAGQVRWVFRHFPLSGHANAQKEAEAALCVGQLGDSEKYWDFIDKVYERTTATGTGFALDQLAPLAKEVGVDQAQFTTCLDGGEMTARVEAEMNDGVSGGAEGTPTTFLVDANGTTITAIPGAFPFENETNATQAVKYYLDNILPNL